MRVRRTTGGACGSHVCAREWQEHMEIPARPSAMQGTEGLVVRAECIRSVLKQRRRKRAICGTRSVWTSAKPSDRAIDNSDALL